MTEINRRRFLGDLTRFSGMAGIAPSLQGLTAYADSVARAPGAGRPAAAGYGPLRPAGAELALPEGFSYAMFGLEGSPMSDGTLTPRAHDGMAAFGLPNGNVLLIRNHENRDGVATAQPFGVEASRYDPIAGGGTTSLEVRLDAAGRPALVRDFVSLSGTLVNCAGGPTPWGTWLSCEETTAGLTQGWARPHGYVFEVPLEGLSPENPAQPLRALGRFTHEAVAIDPQSGIVYLTEDTGTAGFYRFIPDRPGSLAEGGRLQMLVLQDEPNADLSHGQTVGRPRPVRWVEIENADPEGADVTPLAVFYQGRIQGGAAFSRLEGCWYGDGSIYFDATDGGDAGTGQIWQYRPQGADEGVLQLIFESPSAEVLNSPDNLTVTPRGGLIICEDTSGAFVRGLTPEGEIFDFARNLINAREFAGACFSPDGRTLFVNIQGDTSSGGSGHLGMTFGIWGPWERGPL